ncbi:hypothetical protein [Halpernia humi]|uniref:hypothetical protein n=1 Tax=Halpernia humi TaxID=493375 RepID=UPI0011B0230C|nr:hypothetical protein [Halpernia humi]
MVWIDLTGFLKSNLSLRDILNTLLSYFVYGFLKLLPTFFSYTQAGILTTELPTKNRTLNLPLSCPTKHETPACV